MKTRSTILICFITVSLLLPPAVQGFYSVSEMSAEALRKDKFTRIRTHQLDGQIRFTVAVRKHSNGLNYWHGRLQLAEHEDEFLARIDMRGEDIERAVFSRSISEWGWKDLAPADVFTFTVDSNLLEHSTFTWETGPRQDKHGISHAGGIVFWCNLKVLAEAAETGHAIDPASNDSALCAICRRHLGFGLRKYAVYHDGWYPRGQPTALESLSLLIRDDPSIMDVLTTHELQPELKKQWTDQTKLSEELMCLRYNERLRQGDPGNLILLYFHTPTQWESSLQEKPETGRSVFNLYGSWEFLTEMEFAKRQRETKEFIAARANEQDETTGADTRADQIETEADLERLVAKLDQPEIRIQAFSELLAFAFPKGYYVGTDDWEVDQLHQTAAEAVRTCPDREAVVNLLIQQLKNPATRMQRISDLIRYASPTMLYMRGGSMAFGGSDDPEYDRSRELAADALLDEIDVETIDRALESPEWHAVAWGIWHFGGPDGTTEAQATWLPLLPKLKRVAVESDSGLRQAAIQALSEFPEAYDFIQERTELETSPSILMRLMYDSQNHDGFRRAFVDRLLGILNHSDESIRLEALGFIGFSQHRAPMWQFEYNEAILARVIELTLSPSDTERSSATFALTHLRFLDPGASREAFLRLASDSSSDVRWRVAHGLKEQFDRADVQEVLTKLLNDPVPAVRYQTIQADGPEKYLAELEQLTRSEDPRIVEKATGKLKQISERNGKQD